MPDGAEASAAEDEHGRPAGLVQQGRHRVLDARGTLDPVPRQDLRGEIDRLEQCRVDVGERVPVRRFEVARRALLDLRPEGGGGDPQRKPAQRRLAGGDLHRPARR
jgi:hypothetical protein